ncbi:hypothetical protein [Pseudomonas subflava]|uniref:hypothetical protein n=1 Tax=Pseudomonas subflava TaxID=2952933 RepID=UPI002079EA09|nr:hypothetical protein [Pseudomonas subflava]
MTAHISHIQFLGEQPAIVGQACSGLVLQHFYDGKSLIDHANVTYLQFSGTWHRIYFEPGTVFWRSGEAPDTPINSTLEHGLLLNNLSELSSISGSTLRQIDYLGNEAGDVDVLFKFDGGSLHLKYSSAMDSTQVELG